MEDERRVPDPGAAAGGALVYAIPSAPRTLDPLRAVDPVSRLISRQVHEPLVDEVVPALGEGPPRRGLALSWSRSPDASEWRLRLRRRVLFQDGAVMDAAAVVVNVRRWQTLEEGRTLLPGLETADAPRPTAVRLVFNRPVPDLPRRLADGRLGIVSPDALAPPGGELAVLERAVETGTGPFEVREQDRAEIMMVASPTWWGERFRLGPALDQVRFRVVGSSGERLELLRAGEVQVAAGLSRPDADAVAADPLLTVVEGPGGERTGIERSVRGVEPASRMGSLSSAWLTTVGTG